MSGSKPNRGELLVMQLTEAYDALIDALHTLCDALRVSTLPVWAPLSEVEQAAGLGMRDKIILSYQDLWYEDGQDGRATRSSCGLVGADEALLAQAQRVNDCKSAFQQAAQALNAHDPVLLAEHKTLLPKRSLELNEPLKRRGLARLHLKQAYRHLPILWERPEKIGFSWYRSGRSIKRITVKEAYEALLQLNTEQPHIQLQLQKLAALSPREPLAQVQTLAPIMRANIVYPERDGEPRRSAQNVSLPLLVNLAGKPTLPRHNTPDAAPPEQRTRKRRSDIQIEDEAYLPSLRVHLYKMTGDR